MSTVSLTPQLFDDGQNMVRFILSSLKSRISTPNEHRSLMFMAMGVVAGLVLAGHSLFTARGTSTLFVPPENVAMVNQQPISRVDYLLQLMALYGVDLQHSTAAERKKVLNDMIREELFVQRGKELDVALSDPDVRSAMVNAVELEIAADAITSQPDDAKLRAFYEFHQAEYASEGLMTLYNYVCAKPPPDVVLKAQVLLRQPPPARDELLRLNFKPSGLTGAEEYYFAAHIHLGDRLFEAARELNDQQESAPIELADGVHILFMVKNTKPVRQSFAVARSRVLSDYLKAAISRTRSGEEVFLRKRANILIADDIR